MARKVFDAVIRHRIDLERHATHEARATIRLLSQEDIKLVDLLRKRLPNLAPRDLGKPRAKALLKSIRNLRRESHKALHDELRDHLHELSKVEGATVKRIVESVIPIETNPIRTIILKGAVTKQPFAGGGGASRTLGQWFGKLATDDQARITGAVQTGIHQMETVDQIVRRVAGTKANKFADGALAISRRAAEVAVRTAVVHVANAAQLEWSDQNSDFVSGNEWVAILDNRTCMYCETLNGGFVAVGDAKPPSGMKDLGGQSPPAHPRCRCALVPVFDLDATARKMPQVVQAPAPERPPAANPLDVPAIARVAETAKAPSTEDLFYDDRAKRWAPERERLHSEYINSVTEDVPTSDEPTLYMTGGGPASGKTTGLLENPDAGIPDSELAAHIDPDGAKAALPEYVEGVKAGDISAAGRVHEESSYMSKRAVARAIGARKDVVYDSVGDSGIAKLEGKVAEWREAGAKRVVANYATLDVNEAIRRADARALRTGRYVAHDVIRDAHEDVAKTSLAAIERGTFDELKLWDTSERKPLLVATYDKAGGGLKVVDEEAWARYKARAGR